MLAFCGLSPLHDMRRRGIPRVSANMSGPVIARADRFAAQCASIRAVAATETGPARGLQRVTGVDGGVHDTMTTFEELTEAQLAEFRQCFEEFDIDNSGRYACSPVSHLRRPPGSSARGGSGWHVALPVSLAYGPWRAGASAVAAWRGWLV